VAKRRIGDHGSVRFIVMKIQTAVACPMMGTLTGILPHTTAVGKVWLRTFAGDD
jgi:hypothetical protein